MAELPFIDTHFHLHDMKHAKLRYGWLEPNAVHGFLPDTDPLKAQRYRIKDYIAEIRFSNVPKAIHVQAAVNTPDPVAKTDWLQAFAIWRGPTRRGCSTATSNTRTFVGSGISARVGILSIRHGAEALRSLGRAISCPASTRASSLPAICSIWRRLSLTRSSASTIAPFQ